MASCRQDDYGERCIFLLSSMLGVCIYVYANTRMCMCPHTCMHVSIHMRVPRQTHIRRGLALPFCFQFPSALSWQHSFIGSCSWFQFCFSPTGKALQNQAAPEIAAAPPEWEASPVGFLFWALEAVALSGSLVLQRSEANSVEPTLFPSSLPALNNPASRPCSSAQPRAGWLPTGALAM